MAVIDLIVLVCLLSHPDRCEEQRLRFVWPLSSRQCDRAAPPYIAQWINEHPQWQVMRWRCEYPGSREGI
jgi:hypothetical protein